MPKPPERRKGRKQPEDEGPRLSRLQQLREDGIDPDLPPLRAAHIVDWLMQIGPVEAAGMGQAPISWQSIQGWQQLTGIPLEPGQAKLLRRLSTDYLVENRAAEDPDRPPPWTAKPTEDRRNAVSRKLRSIFAR